MTVKKIRKTVRHGTNTVHSRYGRRKIKGRNIRGSTLKAKYSRGKVTGVWSMIPFPRAVARMLGAKWADPRRR